MATLTIRLFGDAQFRDGDRPVSLVALPKSLPLLAYLLVHHGRAVPRDRLAYALWPDETESDARSNLRRHLYRLTRALPPTDPTQPWIVADAKSVRWNADASFWCDLTEFERCAADPARAAEAAALYAGDLLAGSDEPWLANERERLRGLAEIALAQAIEGARRRGAYPAALGFAQQLLALDPLGESAVRSVMALRFESGDRAGALAEYERFAEALYAELGAQPMPETQALCDRIAAGDPTSSDSVVRTANPGDPDRLPFVGRDRELGELDDVWREAAAGRGCTVFVSGDAGIGKSRLLSEFARAVEAQGGSVFAGATAPQETRPYQAVAEALRDALPVLLDSGLEPVWLATLAALVPEIAARRSDLPDAPALDERNDRARLFEAVARAIGACAHARPRLIVLEDLHWASAATLELVGYLGRRIVGARAILAVSARDEIARTHPLEGVRRELQRANAARTVPLRALRSEDVATVLAQRGASPDDLASAAAWLHARTEGNPLFLRLALGTGAADAFDGGIDAVIGLRLHGLAEGARAMADAAAIVGQGFDLDVARDIGGWERADAIDAIDELIDRRIVREASASHATDYAFSHHLLWTHVYNGIPSERRLRGHRRAARALDELYGDRPEFARQIARHYDAADLPERAADHFLRSAGHAARLCANVDAIVDATRAFDLAGDPRVRLGAVALREALHARTGARDAQVDDLRALASLTGALDEPDVHCELWRRRAALAHARAETGDEAAAIAQLEAWSAKAPAARWRAEAALARARYQTVASDLGAALASTQVALKAFALEDDADGRIEALTLAAEIHVSRSDHEAARASLREARTIAERFISPVALLRVVRATAAVAFIARDFDAAEAAGREALTLCERVGDVEGEADVTARLAAIALRRFDVGGARSAYDKAAERYAALGNVRALAAIGLNAAMIECAVGEAERALERFTLAGERFAELDDPRGCSLAAANGAFACTRLGRDDEAVARARAAIAHAERSGNPTIRAHALSNLALAQRHRGEYEASVATALQALPIRRATQSQVDVAEDLADLALTYLLLGRSAEALATIEEFLPHVDALSNESLFAHELWWTIARVLRASGDPRADDAAARARTILSARLERLPEGAARARFAAFCENPHILAS